MDSGALVPDDIIIDMMIDEIARAPAGGYVLDGFPRTVVQAGELDEELSRKRKKIDAIVNLVIDDSVLERRLTGRRSCPACSAIYHIDTLKPKVEGVCDKCGKKLAQRTDDKPEVVKQRLVTYHQQTAAVVGYYTGKKYRILDIDAEKSISEVTSLIFAKLDNLVTA